MVIASAQAMVSFLPPPHQTFSRQNTSPIFEAVSISLICPLEPATTLFLLKNSRPQCDYVNLPDELSISTKIMMIFFKANHYLLKKPTSSSLPPYNSKMNLPIPKVLVLPERGFFIIPTDLGI